MADNQKTLFLLGASADQMYAIRTAKEMGLRTLVVDGNPDSPGFQAADDHAVVSTRDSQALIKFVDDYIAKGGRIDGVLVMGSDIPQFVVEVAEHLNLPHIPMEAALLSTHKLKMKERFAERGVPVPWFKKLESLDDLKSVIRERGYPLIIKPVDRSGARGVYRLTEGCDVEALYNDSVKESFCGDVMVEEYLSGLQISSETIMHNGNAYTPGFVDRNYEMLERYAPHIIENGGTEPASVTPEMRQAVEDVARDAGLALGVRSGVVKGDIVIHNNKPVIIEIATRLSGGDFSESLVPLGTGVNYVKTAIQIALGQAPDLSELEPRHHNAVMNRYFFPPAGKLVRVEGVEEVTKQPFIKKFEIWYKPGDMLHHIDSHADRFGVFVVVADTVEEAQARTDWVYDTIKIIVEPE